MRYLLCASWTKQKADACLDFSHFFILNFARDIWSCGLVNGLHEMYGHVHMIYISQNFYFMVNLNVLNIVSTKTNDRCGYKNTFCNIHFLFDFLKHVRVARAYY